MNITFNSDTIARLIHEIDDILANCGDYSAGTADDLSGFLNALAGINETGSIVIVPDDDNLGDDWEEFDGPDPVPPYAPVMA